MNDEDILKLLLSDADEGLKQAKSLDKIVSDIVGASVVGPTPDIVHKKYLELLLQGEFSKQQILEVMLAIIIKMEKPDMR